MLARLAARLLIAPFGFVCATLAVFATLGVISADHFDFDGWMPEDIALLGYDLSINALTLVLLFAPLLGAPAIVAVLIAEMFSIRSWVYHAAAGGLSALMPWSLAPSGFETPAFTASQVLAAGIVGGFTHWLIAGRRSGLADPPPPSTQPPA
jgi:hypothetical protein